MKLKCSRIKYIILIILGICFIIFMSNYVIDSDSFNKMKNDFAVYEDKMKNIADYLLSEEYPVIIINE